jgi:hypothetical protein
LIFPSSVYSKKGLECVENGEYENFQYFGTYMPIYTAFYAKGLIFKKKEM